MLKSIYLIAAIPLVLTGLSSPSDAARRERKPWLSIGSTTPKATATTNESRANPDRVRRTPRRVARTEATPPRTTIKQTRRAEASDPGKKIARQALAYKGTKYKFGGTSKKGVDCSGLVSRIFTDLKMGKVPRVSASLYKSGDPVKTAELRPGDLVFFKNTYKRGISHVGVYAGKNKFVHASNKKRGVIVTSMADPYYQLHYAGARRLY